MSPHTVTGHFYQSWSAPVAAAKKMSSRSWGENTTRPREETYNGLHVRFFLQHFPCLCRSSKKKNPSSEPHGVVIFRIYDDSWREITHSVTQSSHIFLRQLLAAHQVLDPPVERRYRPRVGGGRQMVGFGRARRIDLHVVIHCSSHEESARGQ